MPSNTDVCPEHHSGNFKIMHAFLMSPSLAGLGFLVFTLGYYFYRTYARLAAYPGPFWAKFTDVPRALWVKTLRSHDIYQEIHDKYGDYVRIAPNVVSISDPAAIPYVYPTKPGFPKASIGHVHLTYLTLLSNTKTKTTLSHDTSLD